jgi:hypothetical protein
VSSSEEKVMDPVCVSSPEELTCNDLKHPAETQLFSSTRRGPVMMDPQLLFELQYILEKSEN